MDRQIQTDKDKQTDNNRQIEKETDANSQKPTDR